jgi:hypothetical protein
LLMRVRCRLKAAVTAFRARSGPRCAGSSQGPGPGPRTEKSSDDHDISESRAAGRPSRHGHGGPACRLATPGRTCNLSESAGVTSAGVPARTATDSDDAATSPGGWSARAVRSSSRTRSPASDCQRNHHLSALSPARGLTRSRRVASS